MKHLSRLNMTRASAATAALVLLTACGGAATPIPAAPNTPANAPAAQSAAMAAVAGNISVQEASSLRDKGAFILDVREPSEWNEFHMPNSTLIPLGQLASRVAEVPKDRTVVVVCRSGNRSKAGRDTLLQAGFTNVTSMDGGLTAWRSGGLPVVSGP